jgi:hypothetical protein
MSRDNKKTVKRLRRRILNTLTSPSGRNWMEVVRSVLSSCAYSDLDRPSLRLDKEDWRAMLGLYDFGTERVAERGAPRASRLLESLMDADVDALEGAIGSALEYSTLSGGVDDDDDHHGDARRCFGQLALLGVIALECERVALDGFLPDDDDEEDDDE